MRTEHVVRVGDASSLDDVADESVELVVTSPPYPMIEMWDGLFADLDPAVERHLDAGDGRAAFDAMHAVLNPVWTEVARVLVPGGIACINVGDATRTLDGAFRVYPNHSRVADACRAAGLRPLPDILWRKPANSAAKFMGSGMLPPNAYATLEHEYVLVFRKGDPRGFEPGAARRYESAYFWEERNEWFSDVWTDVRGTLQDLDLADDARDRAAAFPLELPYRLINMYSVYGDTVLDPFWGTGTTSLAALIAGRDSIGWELDPAFRTAFDERVDDASRLSQAIVRRRLRRHQEFVECEDDLAYEAVHYPFPVRTKQEREIRFYAVTDVERRDDRYVGTHRPVEFDADHREVEVLDQSRR